MAGGLTAAGVAILVVCIVGGLLSLAVYFVPVFIAMYRGHPNALAIAAVCLLFGWSFLGWGIALVWSLTAIEPKRPTRIIIEQAGSPIVRQPSDNPFDFG